jgi:hypothetical protein
MKYLLRALTIIPLLVLCSGCAWQSRSETTKQDRITFQAQVPMATAEGVKVVPVTGTIRRTGTEEESRREAPDTEAIAALIQERVTQGLATIGAAGVGGGFPWANVVGGIGAAFTAATTGYLALKKREQMRSPIPKREAV